MAKKNKGGKKGASTAAVALLKETKTPFEIREYEHVAVSYTHLTLPTNREV